MSFSFGFSGDDIEDEEDEEQDVSLVNDLSKTSISGPEADLNAHTVKPKRHTLEELLASLPSQISYNTLNLAAKTILEPHASQDPHHPSRSQDKTATIYRRSLFDIRAQLMAEANPSPSSHAHPDAAETLLAGLENGDLSSGVYEGGFKTWECALDLASLLINEDDSPFASNLKDVEQDCEVIELGAGSAIPSSSLLRQFLRRKEVSNTSSAEHGGSLKLTLCDYNEEVLRLGTAPNVFLNSLSTISSSQEHNLNADEGDLDIEDLGAEQFITPTITDLLARNLSIDFISGGWCPDFVELLCSSSQPSRRPTTLLILASETIYSPSSTTIFSQTLISILLSHRHHHPKSEGKAWIAAKKVYFGVGGGVDEFVREIEGLGGLSRVIFESRGTGVGRVVVEVTVAR